MSEEINLPFPLWVVKRAFQRDLKHGQLPHGGALMTLPMNWFRTLDTVYERYAVISERVLREYEASDPNRRRRESGGSTSEDWEGIFSGMTDAPRKSFEELIDK